MSDKILDQDEFIKWLDANIEKYTLLEMEEFFDEPAMNNYLGQIDAFKKVKEKILENVR